MSKKEVIIGTILVLLTIALISLAITSFIFYFLNMEIKI